MMMKFRHLQHRLAPADGDPSGGGIPGDPGGASTPAPGGAPAVTVVAVDKAFEALQRTVQEQQKMLADLHARAAAPPVPAPPRTLPSKTPVGAPAPAAPAPVGRDPLAELDALRAENAFKDALASAKVVDEKERARMAKLFRAENPNLDDISKWVTETATEMGFGKQTPAPAPPVLAPAGRSGGPPAGSLGPYLGPQAFTGSPMQWDAAAYKALPRKERIRIRENFFALSGNRNPYRNYDS